MVQNQLNRRIPGWKDYDLRKRKIFLKFKNCLRISHNIETWWNLEMCFIHSNFKFSWVSNFETSRIFFDIQHFWKLFFHLCYLFTIYCHASKLSLVVVKSSNIKSECSACESNLLQDIRSDIDFTSVDAHPVIRRLKIRRFPWMKPSGSL